MHLLDRLARYDTATLSDVIDLFNVRPHTTGYLDRRISACFPDFSPTIGYATTAKIRSGEPPASGTGVCSIQEHVERFKDVQGPPIVVCQDLDEKPIGATFDALMCVTYQAFGAVGLVTNGAGRGLERIEQLGFPVFSGGSICADGYGHLEDMQVPVRIGGLRINPGDILHGDRDGVASIPSNIIDELADAADEYLSIEGRFIEALSGDVGSPDELIEAEKSFRAEIDELRARVDRRREVA